MIHQDYLVDHNLYPGIYKYIILLYFHLFTFLFCRGSVPPGARFDPIGPFGRLPVRPPGPGGRGGPRGLHSGDPDNDELQPPVSE